MPQRRRFSSFSLDRLCGLGFLVSSLLVTCPAAAGVDGFEETPDEEEPESGVEVSVSAGYGTMAGRIQVGDRLRKRFVAGLPARVDVGYRFASGLWAGGYAEYSWLFPTPWMDERCPGCSHSWLRLGLGGEYRWEWYNDTKLWVGLSAGQHVLSNGASMADTEVVNRSIDGIDATLRWGAQWPLAKGLAIGPLSSLTLGSFSEIEEGCARQQLCPKTTRTAANEPGVHFFFATGLRITLLP